MKRLFYLLLSAIILASCDIPIGGWSDPTYSKVSSSYVTSYVKPEKVHFKRYTDGTYRLYFEGKRYEYLATGRDKEVFDSLAKANKDITYNAASQFLRKSNAGLVTAVFPNIREIHIVAVNDYDAGHLSGAIIDELVEIELDSCFDYVKNGYAGEKEVRHKKLLSDVNWLEEKLLLNSMNLTITPSSKNNKVKVLYFNSSLVL